MLSEYHRIFFLLRQRRLSEPKVLSIVVSNLHIPWILKSFYIILYLLIFIVLEIKITF